MNWLRVTFTYSLVPIVTGYGVEDWGTITTGTSLRSRLLPAYIRIHPSPHLSSPRVRTRTIQTHELLESPVPV